MENLSGQMSKPKPNIVQFILGFFTPFVGVMGGIFLGGYSMSIIPVLFICILIIVIFYFLYPKNSSARKGTLFGLLFPILYFGFFFFQLTAIHFKVDYLKNAYDQANPQECLKIKDGSISSFECVIDLARDKNRPDFCEYYKDSTKTDAISYCKDYVTRFNAVAH